VRSALRQCCAKNAVSKTFKVIPLTRTLPGRGSPQGCPAS
jgi:hypothetical protein